ncbi:hypothetical protein VII00023_11916 [Vibrio ichthyoenteri ATCC 700023]|uniref:Glycerol kinase n=1 Tax=Vibrio ichthyoenteri ATCC 700023 TaxID=870968 RepID=F9RYT2_9VIBR|nr:hypothetical protein [Vibrio ichthyoenteri]EGU46292.1 hypothetical protein VII00023_11916 [Vibrio ichthyoenteri ATCC 700023]
MTQQKISTSQLAKVRDIDAKQLFKDLKHAGYINRSDESWVLTEIGRRFGGEYLQHPKFGQYIVWPENLLIDDAHTAGKQLTATQIGQRFQLNAKKINQLLSELGWITKTDNGWLVTASGFTHGGQQRVDNQSEQHYAVWHDTLVHNQRLKQTVIEFLGQDANASATDKSFSNFQQKFAAKHRTLDGHYVHSRGELIIDNWLYMNGIVHAYDRPLPIEQEQLCDFYLPSGKVYIQYWGDDQGPTDEQQKQAIKALYQQHQFALIDILVEDIDKLDDVLPNKLREFGIKAY